VTRALVSEIIPEGTAPPGDIPAEIFDAAIEEFLSLRRLDMRALAQKLGIGRATLYRRVAGRDHLLASIVWYLTRVAMVRADEHARDLTGRERIVAVIDRFMRDVNGRPALHRLLDAEPEAALRILTSKAGPIQQGIVDVVAHLIREEEAHGNLRPLMDAETLAYVIVRVGESFLYADVIADNPPDMDRAIEVTERLLADS
jgi:AcrR family transcriptional regulator